MSSWELIAHHAGVKHAHIFIHDGLITSTLLSLLVVPAVFTYIDDLEHLLKRGMARLRRPAPAVPAPHSL